MINKNKIVAIIPARGGSKRLANKNILLLNKKPLIAWSIEAGLGSKYIDEVIVSTDSSKIATIAKKYKANVPFLRPKNISTDNASQVDVILHTIEFLKKQSKTYDYLILLQPTSPLRTSAHIDAAIELLFKKRAKAIISVSKANHSPLWSNKLEKNGSMKHFLKSEVLEKQSQDLDDFYNLNGAIYLVNIKQFIKEKTLFIKKKIYAYKMDDMSSVDIDNELDFLIAEAIVKYTGKKK